MTIVIAYREGDTILMMADTKVSNRNARAPEVVPGRLKVVTFADCATVAFAGNADAAYVVIRDARREFQKRGFSAALEVFRQDSMRGETDYIVAAHQKNTVLLRLRNGGQLEVGDDICTLGDDDAMKWYIERARSIRESKPLRNRELRTRFVDKLLTTRGIGPTVGGFAIAVEAVATGHRYLGHSAFYTYKLDLKWGKETHQSEEQVYSGDGHFEYSVHPSKYNNVPIVGVCLLQARTGYIYSPLEQVHPFRVPLAPPDLNWIGHERQMYRALDAEIESHVSIVRSL